MARKKEIAPSVFRFMCIRTGNTNYSLDFDSKEAGLEYIEELNDPKIEWYGFYEIDNLRETLNRITAKRLVSYDDAIAISISVKRASKKRASNK